MLTLQNVTKKFGSNVALDDVSFEVAPGTVFALLGENGAGKTTAIRIMLGLLKPDRGTSTVLGLDSLKDDLQIRRKTGYVPEQPMLYDWMSVVEIGRFISAFYDEEYWNEYLVLAKQHELPLETKIKSLSKGMRAKVSLCLALANDPELLILDEPTSGLDALVRREFLESMVRRAESGKTVFLSSHQIAEVERVADTVAILKKGKLIVLEPLETLKETTRTIFVTLKNENQTEIPCPFETVIEKQIDGRQIRIIGRNILPNANEILTADENVAQFEIAGLGLEEIFVSYMK